MQAQFFPDLKEFCVAAADKHHKAVIVAGLDGDFRREAFGQILSLVPHADVVTKKVGRCQRCQRPSLFSLRTVAGAFSASPLQQVPCILTLPILDRYAHRAGWRQRGLSPGMSHMLQRPACDAQQRCCPATSGALSHCATQLQVCNCCSQPYGALINCLPSHQLSPKRGWRGCKKEMRH